MTDSSSCDNPLKIYGKIKLWCNFFFLTGKKYYRMLLTFFLVSLPYLVMLVILIKILANLSIIFPIIVTTILYIIEVFSIIMGGCTDPGILPRQGKDYLYDTKRPSLKYVIRGHLITLHMCYSCLLFRPPRTNHCSSCDNCVQRFDHHCIWLGTCIGLRNYRYFYMLISSLVVSALFQIIYTLYHVGYNVKNYINKEEYNLYIIWCFSGVCLFDLLFMVFFLAKLCVLHSYLISKNITFYEYITKKFSKAPGCNKYDYSAKSLIKHLFCSKLNKSFLLSFLQNERSKDKNKRQEEDQTFKNKSIDDENNNITTSNNNLLKTLKTEENQNNEEDLKSENFSNNCNLSSINNTRNSNTKTENSKQIIYNKKYKKKGITLNSLDNHNNDVEEGKKNTITLNTNKKFDKKRSGTLLKRQKSSYSSSFYSDHNHENFSQKDINFSLNTRSIYIDNGLLKDKITDSCRSDKKVNLSFREKNSSSKIIRREKSTNKISKKMGDLKIFLRSNSSEIVTKTYEKYIKNRNDKKNNSNNINNYIVENIVDDESKVDNIENNIYNQSKSLSAEIDKESHNFSEDKKINFNVICNNKSQNENHFK